MAAPTLNVTKGGDGYILRWEVKAMFYKHIKQAFEVQYKKDAASWQVRAWRPDAVEPAPAPQAPGETESM